MIQRLIAQSVLLAVLTGMLAPLAPGIVMPHACCLRHQQHCHMPQDAGISNRTCGHECCRLLAVSSALFGPVAAGAYKNPPASPLISTAEPDSQPFHAPAEHSGRAPPRSV